MRDFEFEFTRSATFGMTDVGKKRSNNEDQFLIAELTKSMLVSASSLPFIDSGRLFGGPQGQVLLVADGMGGHAKGERASSIALQHLISRLLNSVHWYFQSDALSEQDFVDGLRDVICDAHSEILAKSKEDKQSKGMGTTLTMAYINWPKMYVLHVGDSRCYVIRDSVAIQVTTDHTLAHQLVEAGGLRPEEEAKSRWSNVLWNVLGGREDRGLTAEVRCVDLHQGDTVLLCSDGLYRYFNEKDLGEFVSQEQDSSTLCRQLVDFANASGGDDNITVIVSRPSLHRKSHHTEGHITWDPSLRETLNDDIQ